MSRIDELRSRLSKAERAHEGIILGKHEVAVDVDGFGRVTYQVANIDKLEVYIARLRSEIDRLSRGRGRGPIYVGF